MRAAAKILASALLLTFCTDAVLGEDDVDDLLEAMLPGSAACFQRHAIDVTKRLKSLHDCFADVGPTAFSDNVDDAKMIMTLICREKKPIRCLQNFVDQMNVCLNDDMKVVSEQITSAFKAAEEYVCKDNGQQLIELLFRAKTEQCLGKHWGTVTLNGGYTVPSCQVPFKHVVESRNIAAIFDKDNCRIAMTDIVCLSSALRERCDDHAIIEYAEEGLQRMLDATSCQKYMYLTSSGSSHAPNSSPSAVVVSAAVLFLYLY